MAKLEIGDRVKYIGTNDEYVGVVGIIDENDSEQPYVKLDNGERPFFNEDGLELYSERNLEEEVEELRNQLKEKCRELHDLNVDNQKRELLQEGLKDLNLYFEESDKAGFSREFAEKMLLASMKGGR